MYYTNSYAPVNLVNSFLSILGLLVQHIRLFAQLDSQSQTRSLIFNFTKSDLIHLIVCISTLKNSVSLTKF